MADIPEERLFTKVGIDVFGPWTVVTCRTLDGQANSKRLAVLFTWLVTRAVHAGLNEEMTSSVFINALRKCIGIPGDVKIFRSERATNFVGSS